MGLIGKTTACICPPMRLEPSRRCPACNRLRMSIPHEAPRQALAVLEWRTDHGGECTCFDCVVKRADGRPR